MLARTVAAAVTVLAVVAAAVVAWPQLFGAETAYGVAHIVSLRGSAALAAVLLAVALTLLALLVPALRRLAASLAAVALGFTALNAAVLSVRGFGGEGFQTAAPADVTVLAWNTLGDVTGATPIAQLALESQADVVALPETTRATAEEAARLAGEGGRPMQVFTIAFDEVSKARSTSLLVSTDLGEYRLDGAAGNTAQLPSVVAVPSDGSGPTLVAVHAVAPMSDSMATWRDDLAWLAGVCDGANVILAGDFNATLDHMAPLAEGGDLGGCVDAAVAADSGAVGTWPTALPALLGAPIDHVMATPGWQVTGMRVVESRDGAGSDHRPVLAQLRPTA